jgi:hypothetical protein
MASALKVMRLIGVPKQFRKRFAAVKLLHAILECGWDFEDVRYLLFG